MYVCMYVRVYICMYVFVYVCTYVMFVRNVCTYVYTYVHTHVRTYVRAYVHTCVLRLAQIVNIKFVASLRNALKASKVRTCF